MASTAWDPQGEARAALRTIVADPRYGPAALSNSQTMTSLLKDMLPDSPREASVLIAASEVDLPGRLHSYAGQGMGVNAAARRAAASLEKRTALTPEACAWAVSALMSALPLNASRGGSGPAAETIAAGDGQETVLATGTDTGSSVRLSWPNEPRRVAALLAAAGAILTLWACALPYVHVPPGDGRQSFSIFNSGLSGGLWNAAGPVGGAVLAAVAAMLLVSAALSAWLRAVAAGALIALGVGGIFSFAPYQFTFRSPDQAGLAGVVGMLAGLLLLAAGGLTAARRPVSTPAAAGPAGARRA